MKHRYAVLAVLALAFLALVSWTQERPSGRPVAGLVPGAASAPPGTVSAAALPPKWYAPVNISNTEADSESPVAALDAAGNAYVTWTEWYGGVGAPRYMMFTTNKSGQWSAAQGVPLTYTAIDDVGFPQIAATPDGKRVLMTWHDADFSLYLMSIFGNLLENGVWSGSGNISGSFGVAFSYATVAASPLDGSLHVVFQGDLSNGFALAHRCQNGATGAWDTTELIPGLTGGQYLANIHVGANGTAHLVYITRPGTQVWYAKNPTPLNNATWTAPIVLSSSVGMDWTYPKVTSDPSGDAYVVWQEIVGGNSEILLRRTVNGAWQAAENISKTPDLSETASIAVNPKTKEIYIAWQEAFGSAQGGGVNWDVVLKTYEIDKASGQKVWSDNYRVTSTPGHAGEPCLRTTPDGDIHLFYFDNPSGGDGVAEIMHAWKKAIKVTPPTGAAIETQLNKILFYTEKINTITFAKNPDNDESTLAGYKLYRKLSTAADSTYALIATLSTSTFEYTDRRLPLTQKFTYLLSTTDKDGNESEKTAPIVEK